MRRSAPYLLIVLLCVMAAAALVSQARARTRGLDLGAPLNRPDIYGINIDLLAAADKAAVLDSIRQAGFAWVRQSFNWEAVDWEAADALLAAARARRLEAVAVLGGRAPPDPHAFARFAETFAGRYADQVDVYQVWDEPNLESGWGDTPSPADYARLLQAAYTAIHRADPSATVLLAGLAPTVEIGPKNLSDILYLRSLYELGAGPYFDAAAGKPYGFNYPPDDRTVDARVLNFSRVILLREEMVAHGDEGKFLWASHFGWSNRASIWGHVTADQQSAYVSAAFARARNEWPWAGPLFLAAHRPDLPAADPHWGLAVADLAAVVPDLGAGAPPGAYDALHLQGGPYATFEGAWEFSDLGADIPQTGPATIHFDFVGTDLSLIARRGDYRAYLFAAVDGEPANALPRGADGEAYAVLTSPDLSPRVDTIRLASGLRPGYHRAAIRADRGWDQWAVVALRVGPNVARPDVRLALAAVIAVALLGLGGAALSVRRDLSAGRSLHGSRLGAALERVGDLGQTLAAVLLGAIVWASAWLTWGNDVAQAVRKYGDTAPLVVTLITAGVFYYSPAMLLTVASAAALLAVFYLRPDLALPLIALVAPFYLLPRPLLDRAFSMVEICTLLGVAAAVLRALPGLRQLHVSDLRRRFDPDVGALDLAILAFVLVSAASLFVAQIRGVALREFRVTVLEPAALYLLFRLIPLNARQTWRVVDFFLIGAAAVAVLGLRDYVTGANLITAEGGLARIRSVFGSPNNLGLFLGRALPLAAAVALMGRSRARRAWYAAALLPMAAAVALSFSRGALLLGVPAGLATIIVLWGGRRAALALGALAAAGGLALIPLLRLPRFADLFNLTAGTSFFRLQLWRSALAMAADHPLLGVGLDNFLYQYRGRYILPEAWQEPNLPHAHNIFLDFLSRLGLFGLAALLAMLLAFFRVARSTLRRAADPDVRALTVGLVASMAAALAHGMVDTAYWFVDLAFVFMLTCGLAATARRLAAA